MVLPFTTQQFFKVFSDYNNAVWPFQLVLYGCAFLSLYFTIKQHPYSHKVISAILGFFWLWTGLTYHWLFFASINPAAKIFAVLFLIEGILFIVNGVLKDVLTFSFKRNVSKITGIFLIMFATIIYPIFNNVSGHYFPNSPTFGLPCPITLFTFGQLLLADKLPTHILFIPLLWSLIGFTASIFLGVKEDISLLVSGLITSLTLYKNKFNERHT